jgi:hypothetical protein
MLGEEEMVTNKINENKYSHKVTRVAINLANKDKI